MGQDRTREKMMGKSTEGVSLGETSTRPDSRMDEFLARHCKALSTGRLFLLPSSSYILSQFFPQVTPEVSGVLRCVVLSLCSLNGKGLLVLSGLCIPAYNVEGLLVDCSRVSSWVAESPVLSWKDFFRVKSPSTPPLYTQGTCKLAPVSLPSTGLCQQSYAEPS